MNNLNLIFTILVATFINGLFAQQPGDLDSTFGAYGKVTTDFGIDETAYSVAMQPDGKIVVAGMYYWEDFGGIAYSDFALARYKTDGSLDTTFGTGGKLTTHFGTRDAANSVAIQCDGKIVVAGESSNLLIIGKYNFALARYNTNGTLDSSFSQDGKVLTDFYTDNDRANAIAIQPDGKIVVAGESDIGPNYDFALARYNTDGTLDTSFSADGRLNTGFGTDDYAYAIAIQPDGAIVVAGRSLNGANNDFALARYNPNGTLDNSFSTDGKLSLPEIA